MLFSNYDSNHPWIRYVDLVYLELLFCILDSAHEQSFSNSQHFLYHSTQIQPSYFLNYSPPHLQDYLSCCCRLTFQLAQLATLAGF